MSYLRTMWHPRSAPTSLPRRQSGGGCSGGGRLLKFNVCWDAAVCAVSADGFFSVGMAFRKRTSADPSYRPDPPRASIECDCGEEYATHRFWPLRKGDYEWQSTT